MMIKNYKFVNVFRGVALIVICMCVLPMRGVGAAPTPAVDIEITEKQQEIDAINKKIADLTVKRARTVGEAETIALALQQLQAELARADVQLQKTKVTMTSVQGKSKEATVQVTALQKDIDAKKRELHSLLRQLYEFEQESFVRIFFDSQSLSDVISQRDAYAFLQERAVSVVSEMREAQEALIKQKDILDQQVTDLGQLQTLLDAQAQELAQKKANQKKFLQSKQRQQAKYESLITEAQQAREEIKKQVFTLQNGSIKVSLNTANEMAKFAGKATGVRPALIMAVLWIESRAGKSLGTGKFPDNMPLIRNREAFLRITKKLGIDPYITPLSRAGAMGPAQIMPGTWEGMESRIAQLMGKAIVNPYELADAFVATGVFLADKGAQSSAKEAEALQRYVGGKYWKGQSWYSEKVLAVAKEYASQGL